VAIQYPYTTAPLSRERGRPAAGGCIMKLYRTRILRFGVFFLRFEIGGGHTPLHPSLVSAAGRRPAAVYIAPASGRASAANLSLFVFLNLHRCGE
jgi:hypothetical protein